MQAKENAARDIIAIIREELVASGTAVVAIDMTSDLRTTINLDSVQLLRVASKVEKRFGVLLDDDLIYEVKTVADLVDAVAN